jgi:hypothetical protein
MVHVPGSSGQGKADELVGAEVGPVVAVGKLKLIPMSQAAAAMTKAEMMSKILILIGYLHLGLIQ